MNNSFSIIAVFTDASIGFKGNTSTVIELASPPTEVYMKTLAEDFNQPATTFLWPHNGVGEWNIRWFAPDGEIGLCGHGSLAALAYLNSTKPVALHYKGGIINGHKESEKSCTMILNPILSETAGYDRRIAEGLGVSIESYLENSNKHIVLLSSEQEVEEMNPDFAKLRECDPFGYIVTAPGKETDFVSRTIVPKVKQLEDPATGSSHAALTPFWAGRLNKNSLSAQQLSQRGGKFNCKMVNGKVELTGEFAIIATGRLT